MKIWEKPKRFSVENIYYRLQNVWISFLLTRVNSWVTYHCYQFTIFSLFVWLQILTPISVLIVLIGNMSFSIFHCQLLLFSVQFFRFNLLHGYKLWPLSKSNFIRLSSLLLEIFYHASKWVQLFSRPFYVGQTPPKVPNWCESKQRNHFGLPVKILLK